MEIEVKTGFGYFKNLQGEITDKAVLQPGKHEIAPGFTYHEVEDEAALSAVQVYQKPEDPGHRRRKKIQAELEAMAIERLTAKNDPDFK